jgi:hypothetical protein
MFIFQEVGMTHFAENRGSNVQFFIIDERTELERVIIYQATAWMLLLEWIVVLCVGKLGLFGFVSLKV